MRFRNRFFLFLPVMVVSLFVVANTGCTADNEEEFFTVQNPCDTTVVSYSTHIAPIMANSCNSCHSSAFPSGGVVTATHAGLSVVAASGKLRGAVFHQQGFTPMPPGSSMLDSCSLNRISAWINQGIKDN